jgi:hypothetical protein
MAILRNGVNTSTKQADKSAKRDAVIKQLLSDSLAIYWKSKVSLTKIAELITRYTDAGLPVPAILTEKLQSVVAQLPTNQCLYSSQAELDAQMQAGVGRHRVRVQQKVERMRESDLAEDSTTSPCACEVDDKWADQDWYEVHAASGDCCAYKPWI